MTSHDFFTRMIALNMVGPNRMQPTGGEPEMVFVCGSCDDVHEDEDAARECCPPEVYERYLCPVCRVTYLNESNAGACCPGAMLGQPMQCPVCMEGAESFAIAADCCLHTHPTMTAAGRERVAKEVEGGSTWLEAISANAFH